MAQPDFDLVSKTSQLSEAIYVWHLPVWNGKEDEASYRHRLVAALVDTRGKNSRNKITQTQAEDIAAQYKLVREKETTGFTGGIFEDKDGNAVLAIRGTATPHNGIDDGDIFVSGTARTAVTQMAEFWNQDCADLHKMRLVVTGHSLGGALASDFARLFPANTEKVMTFNSAGVSDHNIFSPSAAWWQAMTIQKIDMTWGESKTSAFSTDSGHSLVHGNFGAVYKQVGTQFLIPYAERPEPTFLSKYIGGESHSLVPLADALAFEKVAYDLGLPQKMAEVYIKNIGEYGPQALYNVTDKLAIAVGAHSPGCAISREGFYETIKQIEQRAPAAHGKIVYLGEYSASELAHIAVSDTPKGAAVRDALSMNSPVGLVDGRHESYMDFGKNPALWEKRAAATLSHEQQMLAGGLPHSEPAPVVATEKVDVQLHQALQIVREGLGPDSACYTDSQLAASLSPDVLRDIEKNGYPNREVAALHDFLRDAADRFDGQADKVDRLLALNSLVHISTSDKPLILATEGSDDGGMSPAARKTLEMSSNVLRAIAMGREASLPASPNVEHSR